MDAWSSILLALFSSMWSWKINLIIIIIIITAVPWKLQIFPFLCGFDEESRIEGTHMAVIHSY